MSDSSADKIPGLYAPRTWPTWFGFALVWLIIRLPFAWIQAISRLVGKLLYPLLGRRRRIGEINLQLCFPDLSEAERKTLLLQHIQAMVMAIFEMGMAWWLPEKRLRRMVTIKGLEHLDRALEQGNGALLISAHFTSLELMGRLFSIAVPHAWSGMYRPHENPVIQYFFQRDRAANFESLIKRDDVRSFIKKLREGKTAWIAPDQNYRNKGYVTADFFGVPAPTQGSTARLIKMTGAAPIPFEYRRLPGNEGYLLEFYPPLTDFPTGDDSADAQRINEVFENFIRHAPEQYFWLHRRFKMPRDAESDVYRQHKISGN